MVRSTTIRSIRLQSASSTRLVFAGFEPRENSALGQAYTQASITITPRSYLTTPAVAPYDGDPRQGIRSQRDTCCRSIGPAPPPSSCCASASSAASGVCATVYAKVTNASYTNYNLGYSREPASRYAASVALPYAGKWRIRSYHCDADHAATYSTTISGARGWKYVTAR